MLTQPYYVVGAFRSAPAYEFCLFQFFQSTSDFSYLFCSFLSYLEMEEVGDNLEQKLIDDIEGATAKR